VIVWAVNDIAIKHSNLDCVLSFVMVGLFIILHITASEK